MKKYLFISVALLAAGTAAAQDDISKQLEVTRAYTPRVDRAVKLPIAPDMTDTVRLRPEISYRINSTASSTSFETRPFEPATLGAAPFGMQNTLYLRAGAGVPLRSAFDLYFTPRTGIGSTFGLFANHRGSWSKIVNDIGAKARATETYNGVGLWGTRQFGRGGRYILEGDVSYDRRSYDPYGAADIDLGSASSEPYTRHFVYDRSSDRIVLGKVRGGVSFGDTFTDLSRFNFRVGVDGGYSHSLEQGDLDFSFTAAKMGGERGDPRTARHGFEVTLAERGATGPERRMTTVTFAPRYLLEKGKFSLKAGLDVRYVNNKMRYDIIIFDELSVQYGENPTDMQDYFGIAPSLEARFDPAGGRFVPFLSYTSRTVDGSREALSRRNPYITDGGPTGWVNDLRIGFSGSLGDVFTYKLAGGISMFDDYLLFVGVQGVGPHSIGGITTEYDYRPMSFLSSVVNGSRFTAGAELGLHNLGGFGARLYGNWNRFTFNGSYGYYTPVGDLPDYDAGVELSYRLKDVFTVRMEAELVGDREYTVSGPGGYFTGSIEPAVDISFGAEVRATRDLWIFAEGRNLANQRLYPWPTYRGLGASVMAGVKIVF